jgi:hypothetical protein
MIVSQERAERERENKSEMVGVQRFSSDDYFQRERGERVKG